MCDGQDEIKEVAGFCPLKDLIKALADDVPGVAEYVRRTLARYKADEKFEAAGKPCLELQDALSKQLPREIHQKMLPAGRGSRTIALRQTSKTMRTAVQKADAVVQRGAELVSSRRPRAS